MVFLLAGFAGCGVVSAQQPDSGTVHSVAVSSTAAGFLAAGDSALVRLDLAAASAAYTRAHQVAPQSYEAAWKLARALADQATLSTKRDEQERLCQEAESMARAAIMIEPRGAKGHAFLAVALGKLALFVGGKRKVRLSHEVKAEADTALALDPDEDLAHHVLGVWNREIVKLPGVLKFFAKALYGKLPDASMDAALDHLTKARSLRPDVIPHRVELGITLASAGSYREAKQELEGALRMPTSWVTDDYYRDKARKALADVERRAR